jgi:hypothetical protein
MFDKAEAMTKKTIKATKLIIPAITVNASMIINFG